MTDVFGKQQNRCIGETPFPVHLLEKATRPEDLLIAHPFRSNAGFVFFKEFRVHVLNLGVEVELILVMAGTLAVFKISQVLSHNGFCFVSYAKVGLVAGSADNLLFAWGQYEAAEDGLVFPGR